MNELSDDPIHPTLFDRLQRAAVERARIRGDVVDDVVLDSDGAIDLTVAGMLNPGTDTAELASAPASTSGDFAQMHDVTHLYAEFEPEEEEEKGWLRRGWDRPLRSRTARDTAPALSTVPLTTEVDETDETIVVTPSPGEPKPIDLRDPKLDAGRPTDECRACGGTGRRDLFDPFNQVDYFSCVECSSMWQAPHN